jgi:hypothetical protein
MNAAHILPIDVAKERAGFHLGPAEVISATLPRISVKLAGGRIVEAELALAFPYQPVPGDMALVIGDGSAHYVIGVLRGSGRTLVDLPGDVDIRASGKLRLSGDAGVEIQSPSVSIEAGKLSLLAGAVVHRFRSLRQRVVELVSLHAGATHTVVEGSTHAQSKTATILTQEKVSINGREVHLG